MTRKFVTLLIILITLFTNKTIAQNEKTNSPVIIKFGIYIKKIVPDFKENKFYTEFFWWVKFKNDSTKTGFSNSDLLNLQYVNASNVETGAFLNEIEEGPKLDSEGEYYCEGYHGGDFYFNPDYTYYPFDEQRMDILVEHAMETTDKIKIMIDSSSYIFSKQKASLWGVSNDIINNKTASYKIFKSEIKTETGLYNTNFGDPEFSPSSDYSRLNTSIYLNRSFAPYIAKLIIPIFII